MEINKKKYYSIDFLYIKLNVVNINGIENFKIFYCYNC